MPRNKNDAPPDVDALSDTELLLLLARESIKRTGNFGAALDLLGGAGIVPTAAPAPAQAPQATAPVPKEPRRPHDWKKATHTCPKCSHTGPIETDFGTRFVRGVELKQSWCNTCRASTNYNQKKRTYSVSHASGRRKSDS